MMLNLKWDFIITYGRSELCHSCSYICTKQGSLGAINSILQMTKHRGQALFGARTHNLDVFLFWFLESLLRVSETTVSKKSSRFRVRPLLKVRIPSTIPSKVAPHSIPAMGNLLLI